MNYDKEYEAEIVLGIATDTYDAEGKITSQKPVSGLKNINQRKVAEALKTFTGVIVQTVPAFSAVKVHGQKLYQLARKGKKIELPKKTVTIYSIKIISFKPATAKDYPLLRLRVTCSKGTYIRSLAHDLGKKLGCGAYLTQLVRTRIGPYSLEKTSPIGKLIL